jgi:hypothetical protein
MFLNESKLAHNLSNIRSLPRNFFLQLKHNIVNTTSDRFFSYALCSFTTSSNLEEGRVGPEKTAVSRNLFISMDIDTKLCSFFSFKCV